MSVDVIELTNSPNPKILSSPACMTNMSQITTEGLRLGNVCLILNPYISFIVMIMITGSFYYLFHCLLLGCSWLSQVYCALKKKIFSKLKTQQITWEQREKNNSSKQELRNKLTYVTNAKLCWATGCSFLFFFFLTEHYTTLARTWTSFHT